MYRERLIQSPRSRTSTSQSSNSSDMEASEPAFCMDSVIASVQDTTDAQMYMYSSGRVEEDTGSLHSSRESTAKELASIAEDMLLERLRRNCSGSLVSEESEIFEKDTPLRRNCSSFVSEESERRSNQESELACLHGVRNRYEDAPQLDETLLPIQEQNPGTSLCVLSEKCYLLSCIDVHGRNR